MTLFSLSLLTCTNCIHIYISKTMTLFTHEPQNIHISPFVLSLLSTTDIISLRRQLDLILTATITYLDDSRLFQTDCCYQ
jgi:hypothetical protein